MSRCPVFLGLPLALAVLAPPGVAAERQYVVRFADTHATALLREQYTPVASVVLVTDLVHAHYYAHRDPERAGAANAIVIGFPPTWSVVTAVAEDAGMSDPSCEDSSWQGGLYAVDTTCAQREGLEAGGCAQAGSQVPCPVFLPGLWTLTLRTRSGTLVTLAIDLSPFAFRPPARTILWLAQEGLGK